MVMKDMGKPSAFLLFGRRHLEGQGAQLGPLRWRQDGRGAHVDVGRVRIVRPEPRAADLELVAAGPQVAERDPGRVGSPGRLEYQGVHTGSGKLIFHRGPFNHGTNNVGEFLAVVHMLGWLKQKGIDTPVYTDSGTAIAWIRKKLCNTSLMQDKQNAPLFELIAGAEDWLNENREFNRVLKWDTRAWGEIPADFNRK